MKPVFSVALVAWLLAGLWPCQLSPKVGREPLGAPTYYVAVKVHSCTKEEVSVLGASNLPSGSQVILTVSDFEGDGWRNYSDESHATLDQEGFFKASVHSIRGMLFRRNLLVVATFTTFRPPQPEEVLRVVGRNGANLGGSENPQLAQWSGQHYGLSSIARIPACGGSPRAEVPR